VINDGSTDRTPQIVEGLGEKVISLPFNLGYGGALQAGYKYVVEKDYELVVQFDGDGQHNPDDIFKLVQKFYGGDADIVIGSRFLAKNDYRPGFFRWTGIRLFSLLIYLITRLRVTDPTSGLQAVRAFEYYARKGNFPEDYPDADTLVQMILSGYRVAEIPAVMYPRKTGTSMHGGFKTIFYIAKVTLSIFAILLRIKLRMGVVGKCP